MRQQVVQRHRAAVTRQRVIPPANKMEPVGAEALGAQFRSLDLCRRESELGASQANPQCALVRQGVGDVEFDARVHVMELG